MLLQNEKPTSPFRDSALGSTAYVNLISTPYPGPLTLEEKEHFRQQQDEAEEEAREAGGDLSEDWPIFIRAHLPSVLPDMYSEVDGAYDLWAQEFSQNSDRIFMP